MKRNAEHAEKVLAADWEALYAPDGAIVRHQQGIDWSRRLPLPFLRERCHYFRLIDVGCGIGRWARTAKETGLALTEAWGIDCVPAACALAREHCDRVWCADLLALPAPAIPRAGLVSCLETLEHLPGDEAQLRAFAAALVALITDDGALLIQVPRQGRMTAWQYHVWDFHLEDILGLFARHFEHAIIPNIAFQDPERVAIFFEHCRPGGR